MFVHRSLTVSLGLLVCLALGAGGCKKNDLSTPKSAAKSLAKAMEAGDVEAAKAATTNADPKLVEAMVKLFSSMSALREAAIAKFGDSGKEVFTDQAGMADLATKVDSATEQINGDSATLTLKQPNGSDRPLKLKKVDGDWKVDLGELTGPMAGAGAAMMDPMIKAASDTTAEIKADKYKTAADAKKAMTGKMMAAMLGDRKPPTQPE